MKIELLFLRDCPNYLETWSVLEDVLQTEGISVSIEMVEVQTLGDARRLRFPGSPTIRIDGEDIEEPSVTAPEDELRYRRYEESSGPRGMPPRTLIRKAVLKRLDHSGKGPITAE